MILLPQLFILILCAILITINMAAKNPKRVAAGKKAWRNRGKGKGKSRARGRSGGRGRRKPIQRGILGKAGAFVAGVIPVSIGMAEAAQQAHAGYKKDDLSILSTLYFGLIRFTNNMGNGIIGVEPFNENMKFAKKNGTSITYKMESGIPKGSLLSTIVTGIGMMAADFVASKLAGNRPVKIMGTNYNATGGS